VQALLVIFGLSIRLINSACAGDGTVFKVYLHGTAYFRQGVRHERSASGPCFDWQGCGLILQNRCPCSCQITAPPWFTPRPCAQSASGGVQASPWPLPSSCPYSQHRSLTPNPNPNPWYHFLTIFWNLIVDHKIIRVCQYQNIYIYICIYTDSSNFSNLFHAIAHAQQAGDVTMEL